MHIKILLMEEMVVLAVVVEMEEEDFNLVEVVEYIAMIVVLYSNLLVVENGVEAEVAEEIVHKVVVFMKSLKIYIKLPVIVD